MKNNYHSNIKKTIQFKIKLDYPKVLNTSRILKQCSLFGVPCWIWVRVCVLLSRYMLTVSHTSVVVAAKFKWNLVTHFLPIHISSPSHSSVSKVCSARVYSQCDGSTGQKAARPIEKTPALRGPGLGRQPTQTQAETHICTTILVRTFIDYSKSIP